MTKKTDAGNSLVFAHRDKKIPLWIILPGLADAPATSRRFGEHLIANGGTCWIPDLRDYAGAAEDYSDVRIEGIAERLILDVPAAARDAEKIVVGHSLGAYVGIALGEQESSVAGLVAIEGSFTKGNAVIVSQFAAVAGEHVGYQKLIDTLDGRSQLPGLERYLDHVRATPPVLFSRLVEELVGRWEEFADRFKALPLPKLYIAGERSVGQAAYAFANATLTYPSTVVVVPGVQHWVHIEAADAAVHAIRGWAEVNVRHR